METGFPSKEGKVIPFSVSHIHIFSYSQIHTLTSRIFYNFLTIYHIFEEFSKYDMVSCELRIT